MIEPTVIDIWPGLAPGEITSLSGGRDALFGNKVLLEITRPELQIYLVGTNDIPSPMILVLPGGGYDFISDDHEGVQIARWLNTIGYSSAVLTYRIPHKRDDAYADLQRTMRLIRSRAAQYCIDRNKLGTIGFSAGGHLAARLASTHAFNAYQLVDEVDSYPTRPDFTMLIYPAYLCGDDKAPALEVRPHVDQGPVFLMQTDDDPFECSKEYASAAHEVGVKTRLISYEFGGHGYGLNSSPILEVSHWHREAEEWLSEVVGPNNSNSPRSS